MFAPYTQNLIILRREQSCLKVQILNKIKKNKCEKKIKDLENFHEKTFFIYITVT